MAVVLLIDDFFRINKRFSIKNRKHVTGNRKRDIAFNFALFTKNNKNHFFIFHKLILGVLFSTINISTTRHIS